MAYEKQNEDTLMRVERRMIRMICGVTLSNRVKSLELQGRLGLIDDIITVVRKATLRWFGHMFRRESSVGIKKAFEFRVEGKAGRGRPNKTWYEAVKTDMNVLGIKESEAWDSNCKKK